ncbi:MAG TPA: ABC transporter permease [bacterium]|jgi:peptide/nickel transport system permease protein|nr:ABC transporter permease [bacterium]
MIAFIIRRLLAMIPTLFFVSIATFIIIQLPPGDFLTSLQALAASSGSGADKAAMDNLRHQYGLDQPKWVRYVKWVSGFPRGDFGYSFEWKRPVRELIADRLGLTILLSVLSLVLMWIVAVPVGIYSATHQYSGTDNTLTALAFLGLSVPDFLLGLVYVFIGLFVFGASVTGLFSQRFADAPWSAGKVLDLSNHLFWPALILAVAGMTQLIRILRGSMLEVVGQQFVRTARAKGLSEQVVIHKHAVRVAINPLVSVMGMQLPQLISGATILGIVLSLPTTGPMFIRALTSQDMYLAGTFLLFLALMLMVGNLLADVALAAIDPRIRYQ